ncbi:hypothetical protein F2Q70_00027167 [Brassica cretica]|uniref:Uncharacterized protein n=1 Tax=Brassica cretica TaxID=69181 RepID=A0A3N6S2C4_BRACR|nr:hypothetical protein F2Q70_00027167 [Brassica cretica]KAF3577780.1 hypothetical protein DY000_02033262 [Brassica cretica]
MEIRFEHTEYLFSDLTGALKGKGRDGEIMKLDIAALEQALTDAMKIQEESIQEKDQLKGIIEEAQFQFREAQEKAKSF